MSKVMQLEMAERRYKPRWAVCPEPHPNHNANCLCSLPSWSRALCAGGWRVLGTCLALVYLGVLWLGSWQATEGGHPHYRRCSETPWQMECCQQFHYTRCIAKECPKVPGKIILLLGKTAAWTQASPARGGTWATALSWCCYILDGK